MSGDFPVIVSENISSFFDKHRSNGTNAFRSGLVKGNMKMDVFSRVIREDGETIDDGYDVDDQNRIWRNGNTEEYSIRSDDPKSRFQSLLKKKLAADKFTIYCDTILKEYTISPLSKGIRSRQFPETVLLAIADSLFQQTLPFLKGHTEFDIYSKILKNDVLDEIIVHYRRIFKHGIVRYNPSWVDIGMDASGNLTRMVVKWPTFEKIKNNEVNEPVKMNDDLKGIIVSQLDLVRVTDTAGESLAILKAEISGVSFGWFPSDAADQKVLTPCYSFSTHIWLSNGKREDHVIDIPVLKKYYPK
jgi:hypothetical protein